MNASTEVTTPPTPLQIAEALDDCRAGLIRIVRLTHFQMRDIEMQLDVQRARRADDGMVTISFQTDGIDATLWLMAEVWSQARDLEKLLDGVQDMADVLAEAPR